MVAVAQNAARDPPLPHLGPLRRTGTGRRGLSGFPVPGASDRISVTIPSGSCYNFLAVAQQGNDLDARVETLATIVIRRDLGEEIRLERAVCVEQLQEGIDLIGHQVDRDRASVRQRDGEVVRLAGRIERPGGFGPNRSFTNSSGDPPVDFCLLIRQRIDDLGFDQKEELAQELVAVGEEVEHG